MTIIRRKRRDKKRKNTLNIGMRKTESQHNAIARA